MVNNKFPIGTELTVEKDYELKGFTENENPIQVKKGDKVLVTKSYLLHLTGEGRGKMTLNEDLIDTSKYDIDNISLRILDTLISTLGQDFKDFMEDRAITKKELFNEILEELDYFI